MYFNILTPSELSDHCLINAAIKTRSIEREISPEMNYLPGKFIWSDEKREIYINSLFHLTSMIFGFLLSSVFLCMKRLNADGFFSCIFVDITHCINHICLIIK
jgi:hypothetical protein